MGSTQSKTKEGLRADNNRLYLANEACGPGKSSGHASNSQKWAGVLFSLQLAAAWRWRLSFFMVPENLAGECKPGVWLQTVWPLAGRSIEQRARRKVPGKPPVSLWAIRSKLAIHNWCHRLFSPWPAVCCYAWILLDSFVWSQENWQTGWADLLKRISREWIKHFCMQADLW